MFPDMKTPETLVIADGDWPTAVAVYLQPDLGSVALWAAEESGAIGPARGRVTRRLAETARVPLIDRPASWLTVGRSATLMAAALEAHRFGATRVVDPVMVEGDPETMAREVERAQLVEGLLESDGIRIVLDQPLVDLTAAQVAVLAIDQGLPAALAWVCDEDASRPCGGCDRCRHWAGAFADAAAPPASMAG